ncbi:hypothetical protein [Kineococcus sp. SYSU DK005]|uniref:hypothetical protein n=1 Tax=Kineococcus sp. SYSU DK005 TaxID=3383126 RepID=UPI003D7C9288
MSQLSTPADGAGEAPATRTRSENAVDEAFVVLVALAAALMLTSDGFGLFGASLACLAVGNALALQRWGRPGTSRAHCSSALRVLAWVGVIASAIVRLAG